VKNGIFSIFVAIISFLTVYGQVTFTGVGAYHVIEVTPVTGTGLDMIYVIYNTNGVGMTYHSASGERVIWYSYDSRGADYAEEITCISCDSSTTSLSQVLPNSGYIIVDGNERYCCWVVNYADYYLELNDMFISNDEPCSLMSFRVDGNGARMTYTTIDGHTRVLDREIKLTYNTLVWSDDYAWWGWMTKEVIESFESIDDVLAIEPPLCNTGFVLTGDRFLQAWGLENAIESEYYQTQAVDCRSTAEQDYSVYDYSDDLGGWAPCHIVFSGYPTDAVVYRAWEMATDAEFENVIKRFNQDEVDYTFMDAGTYYMRYMVTNEDGSCNAYGNSHVIKVKSFPIRGDINGDREVNIADINSVIDIILGSDVSDYVHSRADVNSDGEVNIADINVIIDIILKGQPAVSTKDWVDLGLPSGTLWATCNVGANSPEEYGDYFAWGETFSKDYYDWTTYKWCNGSMDGITKYSYGNIYFIDFKSELEPEDDVAYVQWGPSWRMPTKAQQDELREHCTWTWTTQNGVNGYLVIGPNGNSIFLPVAGNSCEELPCNAESGGFYWSRTLNIEINQVAYFLYFDSENVRLSCHNRSFGFPVRAVCVPQN
jgi:hypothetical protein